MIPRATETNVIINGEPLAYWIALYQALVETAEYPHARPLLAAHHCQRLYRIGQAYVAYLGPKFINGKLMEGVKCTG